MPNRPNSNTIPQTGQIYQIRLQGHLGTQWAEWFGGLTITQEENGNTLLAGPVIDQAALYGLLKKVRDLGIPLISVNRAGFDEAVAPLEHQPVERYLSIHQQEDSNDEPNSC